MPSLFNVTAADSVVRLDARRTAEASFTVSNVSGRAVRGRAILVAENPVALPWLAIEGEAERDFSMTGTQQFTVRIVVPAGAPAGRYTFRLDMVDTDNPDENYTQGQGVTFELIEIVDGGPRIPWWLIAVVVGVLLIGGISFGLVRGCQARQTSAEATATAQARATQTALAGAATGTAAAQATQTAGAVQATQTALAQATQTANVQATGTAAAQATGTAAARATATGQARLTATAQAFLRRSLTAEGNLIVRVRFPIIGDRTQQMPIRVVVNLDSDNRTASFRERWCVLQSPNADVAMELVLNPTLNPDGSISVAGSLNTFGGSSCNTRDALASQPINLAVPAGGTQPFRVQTSIGTGFGAITTEAQLQFANVQR